MKEERVFFTRSRMFLTACFCFILAVALASAIDLKRGWLFWLYAVLMILIILLIVFWSARKFRLALLGGIFLLLGLGRFALSEPPNDARHLRFYNGRLVEIDGVVAEEPEEKNGRQTLIIESRRLSIVNSVDDGREVAKGRLIAYLLPYPAYQYGDQLKITCELVAPQKKEGFDYPAFLARQGVWSICYSPRLEKVGEGDGSLLVRAILKVKTTLVARVNRILPEPQASFLNGLLYGARAAIPDDLKAAFNRTGTTHIVAISGYNIMIVGAALLAILKGLYIPRKKAFWLAVTGIIFFVFLTGASASVVRAGLMGLIVLLAKQVGRLSQVGRVLVLVASLMLIINPRLLFFDAGFQLSFAATLGLVYLSPILEARLQRLPAWFGLKDSLTTTMSAIAATLPLIIYQFGRVSLVAPLANLLILPAIPLTMALGFTAVAVSFVFVPLGQVAGWLAWLPLTYIIKVVEFFSGFSWSSLMI